MAFPPAKNGNKGVPATAYATESPAVSTGSGGLAKSIKIKNAAIKTTKEIGNPATP